MLNEKMIVVLDSVVRDEKSRDNLVSAFIKVIERNNSSVEIANDLVDTITYNIRKKYEIRNSRINRLKEVIKDKKELNKDPSRDFIDDFVWTYVIPQELTAFAMSDNAVKAEEIDAVADLRGFNDEKIAFIKNVCEEAGLFLYDKYERNEICDKLGL